MASPFVVLCCGSRLWTDRHTIRAWLQRFPPRTIVIHGDNGQERDGVPWIGADKIAGDVARELGFTVRAYPARWEEEGRAAGPLRNARMLSEEPGIARVLAFTAALKGGSGDMVARAVAAGVVVTVVPPGGRPA